MPVLSLQSISTVKYRQQDDECCLVPLHITMDNVKSNNNAIPRPETSFESKEIFFAFRPTCEPSEVRLVFVLKCICLLCRMLVGESLVSEM